MYHSKANNDDTGHIKLQEEMFPLKNSVRSGVGGSAVQSLDLGPRSAAIQKLDPRMTRLRQIKI